MGDHPPLPDWVDNTRLEQQRHIISDAVDRFKGRNGHREVDVLFLQAPTGTGKTLIAEMIRRELDAKTIYSCTTKALQEQFVRDFPYAKVLMGRANYLTTLGLVDEAGAEVGDIDDSVTCQDCTFTPEMGVCNWCEDRNSCPYLIARGRATTARLSVLNTSYLITDSTGPRRFILRDLYVLDEADVLETELLNHAELHLTNRRMKRLGIRPPKYKTKSDTWADWIKDHVMPKVYDYSETLPDLHTATDVRTIREIKATDYLMENLTRVMLALPKGSWVHDGYSERNYDSGDVIFRPVYIAGYGNNLLWRNGRKFLLMSATILAPEVMAGELGLTLDTRPFDIIDVPSNFPVENRPVHVVPIGDMSYGSLEESKPKMAKAIMGVIRRHPDERILVHCVSYQLANYLYEAVRDHPGDDSDWWGSRLLVTYTNSREKQTALDKYKSDSSAVLFAPSMDRGIDLPDDLCRVQVIAKVPYANLNDKRINARLHSPGGQSWYTMGAIRTIVQMAGRAVRHREDWAVTYILDSNFTDMWRSNSRMFPKYFRDALNFRFNPRLITE